MEFKEEEDTLMKRFLALFLAMLMLLALAAGCTKDDPPADDDNQGGDVVDNGGDSDVIKIGIFEPLSGANAAGGQMEYEGIQVAHSLKGEVLGKKIELVAVDNKSDDVEAVNAAVRLVDSEKVDIVIGSWGSSVAIAAGSTKAHRFPPSASPAPTPTSRWATTTTSACAIWTISRARCLPTMPKTI